MSWNVKGRYFEACNCEAACPCVFLSPPTEDDCTVLVGWHIDKGEFDGTGLDGLNVALAVHSPGHMAKVQWRAALSFDERASEAQSQALAAIFSGQAGGHPARLRDPYRRGPRCRPRIDRVRDGRQAHLNEFDYARNARRRPIRLLCF